MVMSFLYSVLIKKIRSWRETKLLRSGDTKLRAQRSGSQLEARSSFNERAMSFVLKGKSSSQAI